jgi:hypothetical protein
MEVRNAFIVRPFGPRKPQAGTAEIDFDAVEAKLIRPAFLRLGIEGGTTAEILDSGNIRTDMFQRLLTADLVVADLSIHNANVFYELGVRHALRPRRTFLIRCKGDDVPFDLKTERYLQYDRDGPEKSVDQLVAALSSTLASNDRDSPVFQLLPGLASQDPGRFIIVPREFDEEVERAEAESRSGDLRLLAEEASDFDWAVEGLRLVARAQRRLDAFTAALAVWERVRDREPDDREANLSLGAIYHRLDDLPRSDLALRRILKANGIDVAQRSQAEALLGENAQARWERDWRRASNAQRAEMALVSPFLEEAQTAYLRAYEADLNNFDTGLNALALCRIMLDLSLRLPQVWEDRFEPPEEAARARTALASRVAELATAVGLALRTFEGRNKAQPGADAGAAIHRAELTLLVPSARARTVTQAYRKALAYASQADATEMERRLDALDALDLLKDAVAAAQVAFAERPAEAPAVGGAATVPARVLLFSGHTIGLPDSRLSPGKEARARAAIKAALEAEMALGAGPAHAIAGGASGGDVLFHEVCIELGVPSAMYLGCSKDLHVPQYVRPAGAQWVERFNRLHARLEVRELQRAGDLPAWLRSKPRYTLEQRGNLWMIHNALQGEREVALIVLCDESGLSNPDRALDMLLRSRSFALKPVIIDSRKL